MLYSLGDPLSLLLLVAGFLLAVIVQGTTQAVVASRSGDRRPQADGRTAPDPRRHLDPFGAVSGLIAGTGWAKPFEPLDRRRKGTVVAVLVSGPLVNIAMGLGLLVAFRAAAGGGLPSRGYMTRLQYGVTGDLQLRVLLLVGLSLLFFGVLSLVPLPPLPGGHLLFALAPRTLGWQKAEHQLVERNIGVAVLLALMLIPLGGPQALLPTLLDAAVGPLVSLVTGGR
ncbi:MAG: hypothetical protein JWN08_1958 [Frankiales bacterium]|nr:hypothetical protein [Frankiales bacterium]